MEFCRTSLEDFAAMLWVAADDFTSRHVNDTVQVSHAGPITGSSRFVVDLHLQLLTAKLCKQVHQRCYHLHSAYDL
jgi:hypothetical protein